MKIIIVAALSVLVLAIVGCGPNAQSSTNAKSTSSTAPQDIKDLDRLREYADKRMQRLLTPTGVGVKKLDWNLSQDNSIGQVGWPSNEQSEEYILNQEIDLSLRLPDGITFSERGTLLICSRDDENPQRVGRISFHLPKCTADVARDIAKRYIQRWKLKKQFTTEAALEALDEWHTEAKDRDWNSFLAARHENYPIIDIEIHNSFDDKKPWFVSVDFCIDHAPLPAETVAAFEAIRIGDVSTVKRLLDEKLDPHSKDILEDSLLHDAAEQGNVEIVKLLISKGAMIDAKGGYQQTPLWEAILYGHLNIAEILLQQGAEIDMGSNERGTVLHYVCEYETSPIANGELAQWLIGHKASVNAVDRGGDTPLHKSAWKGHTAPAAALIAAGADVNVKNKQGMTPLDNALNQSQTAIIDLLRKHNAKSQ